MARRPSRTNGSTVEVFYIKSHRIGGHALVDRVFRLLWDECIGFL